jgi:hypothetical protein
MVFCRYTWADKILREIDSVFANDWPSGKPTSSGGRKERRNSEGRLGIDLLVYRSSRLRKNDGTRPKMLSRFRDCCD